MKQKLNTKQFVDKKQKDCRGSPAFKDQIKKYLTYAVPVAFTQRREVLFRKKFQKRVSQGGEARPPPAPRGFPVFTDIGWSERDQRAGAHALGPVLKSIRHDLHGGNEKYS